ncbi:MAG: hypothetical protein FJY65_03280 [Calditrichaeota bacterium]|nr:hypothetical protein [Calditrichota bacterium]
MFTIILCFILLIWLIAQIVIDHYESKIKNPNFDSIAKTLSDLTKTIDKLSQIQGSIDVNMADLLRKADTDSAKKEIVALSEKYDDLPHNQILLYSVFHKSNYDELYNPSKKAPKTEERFQLRNLTGYYTRPFEVINPYNPSSN